MWAVLLLFAPRLAGAQVLWSALDTRPKPNMIIAFDTSTTMQIAPGCNPDGCHADYRPSWGAARIGKPWGPDPSIGWPGVRLQQATVELTQTLQLFAYDFIYGGFRYDTCGPNGSLLGHSPIDLGPYIGTAEVSFMTPPDYLDPRSSYQHTLDMVQDIANGDAVVGPTNFRPCEHAESTSSPGGVPSRTCITPTPVCSGDVSWVQQVVLGISGGSIVGVTAPKFPTAASTSTVCDKPGHVGQTFYPVQYIENFLSPATFNLVIDESGQPTLANAQAVCGDLNNAVNQLRTAVSNCRSNHVPWTDGYACDPSLLRQSICNPAAGSALTTGTCICNPSLPNCVTSMGDDPCQIPWYYRSRQQAALCAAYDWRGNYGSPRNIGQAFLSQADNIVVSPSNCRENVVLFFTDGAWGDSRGVPLEADNMIRPSSPYPPYQVSPYYSPFANESNAYVFAAISPQPGDTTFVPDAMARSLGQAGSFPARDQTTLNLSFAEVVNRSKRGSYFAGNPALDMYGTREATTFFSIPGHPVAPNPPLPDEAYLGRPTHISWWKLDPKTGQRVGSSPICETDWQTRAGFSNKLLMWDGLHSAPPPEAQAALGPPLSGETWESGEPMKLLVADDGTTDRGFRPMAPVNPAASLGFLYGFMLNGGSTEPVVVEAPHDLSGAPSPSFAAFELNHRSRPRVIYTMAGGYLFAFEAGKYALRSPPADPEGVGVLQTYYYDDSGPEACGEMFRYLPKWVDDALLNDPFKPMADYIARIIPQPYTNGQIAVREARVDDTGSANDYMTLLVMTQGAGGPNLAALDVSDPTAPSVVGEFHLDPGDTTSAEPSLYAFPALAGGTSGVQTVVVLPSGEDGASSSLYAFTIKRSGVAPLSKVSLPADIYPSSAVCFDATGRGTSTHCVVLSVRGHLIRVPVNGDGTFGAYEDLTPSYAPTFGSKMAGERFYTHPAVYFTPTGAIAYVFGSGDIKDLARPPAIQNHLYKVLDSSNRGGSVDASKVCADTGGAGTTGVVDFSTTGEVMTSPPIVSQGVVSYTTYSPAPTGCTYGSSFAYAMNFDTCADAGPAHVPASPRPQPIPIGNGIAMSPQMIRSSGNIVLQTSSHMAAPVQVSGRGVGARNQARGPVILYWRLLRGE